MKVNKFNFVFIFLIAFFILVNLTFVSAADCWSFSASSNCNSATGCIWRNDSWSAAGWCEEKNCWSLYTQNDCTTVNIPGKNCSWSGGSTTSLCETASCWGYSGTSEGSCVNNSKNLNCQWTGSCYTDVWTYGVNCYNYNSQSTCSNATGCKWGSCNDKGCWNYNTQLGCNAAKDPWNGINCTWSSSNYCTSNGCWNYAQNQSYCINGSLNSGVNCEWKNNYCNEKNCYTWDFTNETTCINNILNLSCSWSGSYCSTRGCWNYNTQSACSNQSKCNWKSYTSGGYCNQIDCWSWDSWNGGGESACNANSSKYGFNCIWQNSTWDATQGWCYKNWNIASCSNKSTEKDCLDTYYCWWQYNDLNNPSSGGLCREPGNFSSSTNTSMFTEWNPGCYIFDMNSTDCNNLIGCNYTGSNCSVISSHINSNEIITNGINCTMINESRLCSNVPILSSCCAWNNGTCSANKLSSACRDQLQKKTEDSCEDAKTQTRCDQMAGSPWYMPCKWINSSEKCEFKALSVFGNGTQSLTLIDNKFNCQAAGGKWIIENYCEGSVSIPTGRCEYKFDEEDNCDKACFACENKDSSGNTVNSTNAVSACTNSKLGMCEFTADVNAQNGIGYCKSKSQFKKGVAGDCDSNCGDCTFKGKQNNNDTTKKTSYYCSQSKANSEGGGCKWITDNSTATKGYCVNKGEKTCEDSCDRCKTQDNCANLGRTSVANQTGSCKWQGDSNTGSCVANVVGDVEVCWDGTDNNNNALIDCADAACYADSSCGLVSGDCFGWTNNNTCIVKGCEWIVDKWGSWCDFKGSQCWKTNTNELNCSSNNNCQWSNGTGSGWCEKDWSIGEICMGINNKTRCLSLSASGCNWTVDTWCQGTGNSTDWCQNNGGWCEHNDFKPKDCWKHNSGSSSCNDILGCNWKTDQYSQPHCEMNYSANCWQYSLSSTCATGGCSWKNDTWGGWCTNKMDACWSSYSESDCNSKTYIGTNICSWQSSGIGTGWCQSLCYNSSYNNVNTCGSLDGCVWKAENGWCEEAGGCWNFDQTGCNNATGILAKCRWKNPGWCDPKSGGFSSASFSTGGVGTAVGGDCYKYDGNQNLCTNKTIINISCGWTINPSPSCDVNWGGDCWKYNSTAAGCTSGNGCWWNSGTGGFGWCSNIMDQCWNNQSYNSYSNPSTWLADCRANSLCTNNSWNSCEPKCSSLGSSSCTNTTYNGKCKWNSGWCNSKGMNEMFDNMEAGAPTPLGMDICGEVGMQASVDICGFGMKDMQDSYGFGANVRDFSNASICNKEKISSFVSGMASASGSSSNGGGTFTTNFGTEKTGSGNESISFVVYLDSDGSVAGGCTLDSNSSAAGYEFRFKYVSQWNASISKAIESFNSYKCDSGAWKSTDIKLSTWKQSMCSEIGGAMIAVKKADLIKYPTLYDSTKDLRVYVVSIGNTGNLSSPTDSAGPGWTTPGSIDFEITDAFGYGADTSKFEDILKKGFVQGEDCFNGIDDEGDGSIDCNDWDCQYSGKCTSLGVNAINYSDTAFPLVTGVKIEEYPDSALVIYDTNKPTNGTLELYNYGDSRCLNKTNEIKDIGLLSASVRDYKLWHYSLVYNAGDTNVSLNWPLLNGSSYYYKLKVCDSNNRCSLSKCSVLNTVGSVQKCGYCNFVTRIKVASGWNVSYDVERDGIYEHLQGQMCGATAGMKTNYTIGRKVNIKLAKSDGSVYFEFLNASLTKTGLNDKVRTISASGDIIADSNKVGLTSETRDKIINNLHPELCRVKVPFSGTCTTLYHCDDNGENCVDRTSNATLISSTNCVWDIPNCEFSTYRTSIASLTPPAGNAGGGGSGGGGGGATTRTYFISDSQLIQGYSNILLKGDKIKFKISNENHTFTLNSVSINEIKITLASLSREATISLGEEKKFELANEGYYDLSVKLNSITNSTKADITIKSINEKIPGERDGISGNVPSEEIGETEGGIQTSGKEKQSKTLFVIVGVIILLIIGIGVAMFLKKKKRTSMYRY